MLKTAVKEEDKMNREIFKKDNYICFTTDLDWAPEAAIEDALQLFMRNNIRPTVFVTHESGVIHRFKDRIDLGIHPNFILPSSQGRNMEEIVDYCLKIVPDAKVFRCHRWYASNDVYDLMAEKGLCYESNLCAGLDLAQPYIHRSGMASFPVYFEDGAYILNRQPLDFKKAKHYFDIPGLKVINIHPMHYTLNTPYFRYTREIKDRLSREEWSGMDEDTLKELSYKGAGIREFIQELVQYAKSGDRKAVALDEAYKMAMKDGIDE